MCKLGYLDLQNPPVVGGIQPGYINSHPAVRDAEGYANSLQDPDPNINPNAECVVTVLQRMEELRRRAVA